MLGRQALSMIRVTRITGKEYRFGLYFRSLLYQSSNGTNDKVILTFDSNHNSFLGIPPHATEADLISYVYSNNAAFAAQLASATLGALSVLDQSAAKQLLPTSQTSNVVLLLGGGGREHALAISLAESPLVSKVVCLPGNGGTASEGGKISNAAAVDGTPLTKMDNGTVIELVKRLGADMVVVGPEQPLVDGVVDELAKECVGVKVFGPSMAGAELEASKVCIHMFDMCVGDSRWIVIVGVVRVEVVSILSFFPQ